MIADVITNAASFSLPALFTIMVVFGFAPGFCMRLIALMYPRTDPRRKELYAELKAVPRIERPLWVAEQLETGLFDGLLSRRRSARERKRERQRRRAIAELDRPSVVQARDVHDATVYVTKDGQAKIIRDRSFTKSEGGMGHEAEVLDERD